MFDFKLPRRIPLSILFHLAVVFFCIGYAEYYIRTNTPTAITITTPAPTSELKLEDLLLADLAHKPPYAAPRAIHTEDNKIAALLKKTYKHLTWKDAKEISSSVRTYSSNVISASLLLGLIAKESSFNKNAISTHGAVGLTQVMPRYHQDKIKGRSLNNIKTSIEVGSRVLRDCLTRSKGNTRLALGCYNGATSSEGIDRYYFAVRRHQNVFASALSQNKHF